MHNTGVYDIVCVFYFTFALYNNNYEYYVGEAQHNNIIICI